MAAAAQPAARPAPAGRRLSVPAWAGVVPFLGYVAVFLIWPVGIVIWDALHTKTGQLTPSTLSYLGA